MGKFFLFAILFLLSINSFGDHHTYPNNYNQQSNTQITNAIPRIMKVSIWRGDNPKYQGQNTIYSTNAKPLQRRLQAVCVEDGKKAYIETSQSFPTQNATVGVLGIGVDNSQYKTLKTGFWVVPKIISDRVQLTIHKQKQQLMRTGNYQTEGQSAQTTILIPFNRWVKFAGTEENYSNNNSQTITYSTDDKNRVDTNFYVKVNLIPYNGYCQ